MKQTQAEIQNMGTIINCRPAAAAAGGEEGAGSCAESTLRYFLLCAIRWQLDVAKLLMVSDKREPSGC